MGYIADCSMREYFGKTAYCAYYDVGYMECHKNKDCPEEDQEEEDDQEYEYEDGYPNW